MPKGSIQRLRSGLAAVCLVLLVVGFGFKVAADCSTFGLPFSDLGATQFCAEIAEAYYTGLTRGTSATTYAPTATVNRAQMAAFVTRTLDQSLLRGSRRAALDQWWTTTPHYDAPLGLTTVGIGPVLLKSDGADVWVANGSDWTVSRVRARDGKLLDTWTGATDANGVLVAAGRVFVTGQSSPGKLYAIDPTAAAGAVTTVASALGNVPIGIAFDGNKIWTSNGLGSVSIITPGTTIPWAVTTVSTGFDQLVGILFDGANIWVTDGAANTLLKLTPDGSIAQTVALGNEPLFPAFDGHNIWVPNFAGNSLSVVRASDGVVLKTFSAANGDQNGLSSPIQAAFDGQRVLVTNVHGGLSLFRATDLSVIGSVATSGVSTPYGVCSDGVDFWVSFSGSSAIGRF
ncbi:MAG TPA: S-layer homology domain-containing protein [Thermoanaerobaculia bacterium]|nr:S-layer homology domain-containing protein [Thermoanaerobaculia bacterium]